MPASSNKISKQPESSSLLPTSLALSLHREQHGPEVKRVPIPTAFLRDFEHELLLTYAHRRGMPAATLDQMAIGMTPILDDNVGGEACRGLRVSVVNPRGETFDQDFNVRLFSDLASQAASELVTEGILNRDENYVYELVLDESNPAPASPHSSGISFGGPSKPEPLRYLNQPLDPLLAGARAVGEPTSDHFPVLYTEDALERAERFARRGGDDQPPRETGAALIGTLCSCPTSGEFYAVVVDALQATDAEEEKLSLSYTGKTWIRLRAVLKSIQSQPNTQTYRLLGQAHGHNFIPLDGAPPCDVCATAAVCNRTSVFVSNDDRTWTQAVFAGAPYALCHIFGLNARSDRVQGLYSLLHNRLTQRGYYVIPEFNPPCES